MAKVAMMHLTICPEPLFIASFSVDSYPQVAHALLRAIFFPQSRERFFSLSETDGCVSLVLDADTLVGFPAETMKVHLEPWIAIRVSEGELGFDTSGIVNGLATPLAEAGISIFYISTFTTDFALVPAAQLGRAITCLEKCFAIITEGLSSTTALARTPVSLLKKFGVKQVSDTIVDVTLQSTANSVPTATTTSITAVAERRKIDLTVPNHSVMVARLDDKSSLAQLMPQLVEFLLFQSAAEGRFFAFTETEEEISLLLPEFLFESYPDGVLQAWRDQWVPIQVAGAPLGFSETGIVQAVSAPLGAARISIVYLSAFLTDYTLVRASDKTAATDVLRGEFDFV